MVSYVTHAVTWGISQLLGIRHDALVAHRDLEHAHWDRVGRRWFTHEDDRETTVAPAA
jgi:hypothetical protein